MFASPVPIQTMLGFDGATVTVEHRLPGGRFVLGLPQPARGGRDVDCVVLPARRDHGEVDRPPADVLRPDPLPLHVLEWRLGRHRLVLGEALQPESRVGVEDDLDCGGSGRLGRHVDDADEGESQDHRGRQDVMDTGASRTRCHDASGETVAILPPGSGVHRAREAPGGVWQTSALAVGLRSRTTQNSRAARTPGSSTWRFDPPSSWFGPEISHCRSAVSQSSL
jgi:hypothetical protein